jgi:hypothetical protein
MRSLVCVLLFASACAIVRDGDDECDDPSPVLDTRGYGYTPGVRAIAGFSGAVFGDYGRPMAAGGATASIRVGIAATAPDIGSLRSSDPSIFEVTAGGVYTREAGTTLMSHHSGTADLVVLDGAGAEIDRTPVSVADSTALALDEEWMDAMPTMLEGFAVPFHVTPIGRDRADHRVILVGTGSVSFHVTGTVSQMPMSLSGDQTVLRGTLGDGAVNAATLTASVDVPIHVVAATTLTAIDAPDAITASATAGVFTVAVRAGSVRVLGAYCHWEAPPGVSIAAISALTYRVSGPVGPNTVTCMAPNGLSKTITLTLR